jgi:tripartite-type tricarboxylate transporter receptor subunit TctC
MRSSFSVLLVVVLALFASGAKGQTPVLSDGVVRVLVGFPAGGSIDVVARLVADQMGKDLGLSFIVENRTGAGGQIAAQDLKRAAPDGHTLMIAPDHTMTIVPLTVAEPGFDALNDFAAVGEIADYAGGFAVAGNVNARTLDAYVQSVRADPKLGSVGVPSAGSKPEFALIAVAKEKNIGLTAVPYRGSVPLVQDLAAGTLPAGITALGDFLQLNGSQLNVLAITRGTRSAKLPDVPTAREQGYPIETNAWLGMFAPAATPNATMTKLAASLNKALLIETVRDRMNALAYDPKPSAPAEMMDVVRADAAHWAPLVAASGWTKR